MFREEKGQKSAKEEEKKGGREILVVNEGMKLE
jgi:hypothetical protein